MGTPVGAGESATVEENGGRARNLTYLEWAHVLSDHFIGRTADPGRRARPPARGASTSRQAGPRAGAPRPPAAGPRRGSRTSRGRAHRRPEPGRDRPRAQCHRNLRPCCARRTTVTPLVSVTERKHLDWNVTAARSDVGCCDVHARESPIRPSQPSDTRAEVRGCLTLEGWAVMNARITLCDT